MSELVEVRATCGCGASFAGEAVYQWQVRDIMRAYRQFHRRHEAHNDYQTTGGAR